MEFDMKTVLIGTGGLLAGGLLTAGGLTIANSIKIKNLADKLGISSKELNELNKSFVKKDFEKVYSMLADIAAKNPAMASAVVQKLCIKYPPEKIMAGFNAESNEDNVCENVRVVK